MTAQPMVCFGMRSRPASGPGVAARAEAEPMGRSAAPQLVTATRRSPQPPPRRLSERRRAGRDPPRNGTHRGRTASDPGAAARPEAEPTGRSAAPQPATATRRSPQPPPRPPPERRRSPMVLARVLCASGACSTRRVASIALVVVCGRRPYFARRRRHVRQQDSPRVFPDPHAIEGASRCIHVLGVSVARGRRPRRRRRGWLVCAAE